MSVLYCPYLGTIITDGQRRMKRGGGKQAAFLYGSRVNAI
jgi:hypothetical protein